MSLCTKDELNISLRSLQRMCPEEGFDLHWQYGKVRLVRKSNNFICRDVSILGTKFEVQQFIYMLQAGVRVPNSSLSKRAESTRQRAYQTCLVSIDRES